jgi:hypothetical protein
LEAKPKEIVTNFNDADWQSEQLEDISAIIDDKFDAGNKARAVKRY